MVQSMPLNISEVIMLIESFVLGRSVPGVGGMGGNLGVANASGAGALWCNPGERGPEGSRDIGGSRKLLAAGDSIGFETALPSLSRGTLVSVAALPELREGLRPTPIPDKTEIAD